MKYILIPVILVVLVACNNTSNTKEDFKIEYEKFTLDNGLEVILHQDKSDPIVAVATMMHVGSNREKPGKTGFAHFFEHMSFNDSENVPRGANRKMIPEWGGSRNGGTWTDGTVYYEVVPKDAFEKILWIDSDRFGYMLNTVTEAALEREKQVVKNEKRQRVDNAPYGYTDEIIRKNLYPEEHPYSWTVIGALPDLQAATLDDVKAFYHQYYGAKNGSLVIAGDIDIDETKKLVEKWFGEIPSGPNVEPLKPMPVSLSETKQLYFEDNFAKLPELRMVIPTVEDYHKDMYALQILANLLSGSKNAPLYKEVVENKKLAPNISTYQRSSELAGEFIIRVRANANVDLDSVKLAIDKGLKQFETNGISSNDLKRIKAELETNLYQGISTVLDKAFQLVQDNEFNGDPSYITQATKLTQAVTKDDVLRVYNTYIKDKAFVMTSVVPKKHVDLAVSNSKKAEVWIEEIKQDVANEDVTQGEEADYQKTPSKHDRSEPAFGELPKFKMPVIWNDKLSNGLTVLGIESNEIPLTEFNITIPGGQLLDPNNKEGTSNLLSNLLLEGTATKTPAQLEEALGMLGATINTYSSLEGFNIYGSCLSKNLEDVLELVNEIILEPRWDKKEFDRLKQALKTNLKGREANPRAIASLLFNKLLYGENHRMAISGSGTLNSANNITLNDLKEYYEKLSPEKATLHIVSSINKDQLLNKLSALNTWNATSNVSFPTYSLPENSQKNILYFIDVPGSKQSVIYAGKLALSRENKDANNLDFANEILGGGSSGKLFQTLRIEKGYTYGAYSGVSKRKEIAPFTIRTSVRANATLKSLQIIEDMVSNYAANFTESDVELTKNKLLKASTRDFESLSAKLDLLQNISKYGYDFNYVEQDQEELINMSLTNYKNVINKYLNEKDMIYVVVGDKATQLDEVKKLGKSVIELDVYGNKLN